MEVIDYGNGNRIFVGDNVKFSAEKISFTQHTGGELKNNILFLESNLNLGKSAIKFHGNNSVVFLNSGKFTYKLKVLINSDSVMYVGKNNYFNKTLSAILYEQKNIFIGEGGMFSFNVVIRNTDHHPIYAIKDGRRINFGKSVFIGDHVWLGQNVIVLKGSQIGSGSIVGAGAVVSGKRLRSNESYVGVPARCIASEIFWVNKFIYDWKPGDEEKLTVISPEKYTYIKDNTTVSFDDIDSHLTECQNSDDKLKYLIELSNNTAKNRFAI